MAEDIGAASDRFPDVSAFRRPSSEIMRLHRMGCAHPTRLSFLRVLLRRVAEENWRFDRPVWDVDAKGVGRAVYCAHAPEHTYSLVTFSHDLPDEMRSDRVIATAWDATFALFDGVPTEADLERLSQNVPLQEAGRVGPTELSLSRANRSVRLFRHVVDRLSEGAQPDVKQVAAVGYLMRTTAVYGAGKFGAADRDSIADRTEMSVPFQAEMLSVWLTRQFTIDIVEHLAAAKGGNKATTLDPEIKRGLGVGNSTGLGMAPFIVRHPILLNNWMAAREEALARIRALAKTSPEAIQRVREACETARSNADLWQSEHPLQKPKLASLRADLRRIAERISARRLKEPNPWDRVWQWGRSLSLEGQEALLALLLEAEPDLVDGLAHCMSANEDDAFRIDGRATVGDTLNHLRVRYDWALCIDFNNPENSARFWYVSEEKLEPRLGNRSGKAGAEREQPLCIARLVRDMHDTLATWDKTESVAAFLLAHPEHRFILRRVQALAPYQYAEITDNLIAQDMLPIDLMRCKLAFFGASRFDPRSDKWVRISLFQGEPYPLDMGMD